jgi:hypothetical protein
MDSPVPVVGLRADNNIGDRGAVALSKAFAGNASLTYVEMLSTLLKRSVCFLGLTRASALPCAQNEAPNCVMFCFAARVQ